MQCFSSEQVLNNHKNNCISINGEQAIKMPEKGETVYLKNHHKQQAVPFVIYADFEALTEKVQGYQALISLILKLTKNIQVVDMVTRLFVVIMINTANQLRSAEEKMLSTNSWNKC